MRIFTNIINNKKYILGIFSIFIGLTSIITLYKNQEIEIIQPLEKTDTLTFLLQDQKDEANTNKNFLASFLTPKINKYEGPVSESMRTCIAGYDSEKIQNIYHLDTLEIQEGSVRVHVAESSLVTQTRNQIKQEIMPVFGHAVKNKEINWTWDNQKRMYTFTTYPGDEALWYCYLRKETIFFTNFFQITQEEQANPLPPISEYRIETYGNDILLHWDYDYGDLYNLLKNNQVNFIVEYKKLNESNDKWIQSKQNSYPILRFQEKKSDKEYYWGEPIEYGYVYNVRISVESHVNWYKNSKPLLFQVDTRETMYPHDIDNVAKINKNIEVTIYAQTENETYKFHPELEKTRGNAFINIYNTNNIKIYTKNLNITNADKILADNTHADKIKKNIQIDTAGIYSAKMCVGTTAENCIEYGLPSKIEVLDFTCKEVFAGHNTENTDRINIVFIGSRYQKFRDFLTAVRESLTWNGKPKILSRFDEKTQKDKIYGLGWGFFAIEPFKSNKDKFNLWYVDTPMTTLTNSVENLCGFNYEYDAIYANRSFLGMLGRTRSFTYKAIFGKNRSKGDPKEMFTFSHNYIPYDEFESHVINYELFAHETGHAVFGLDDEYNEGENSNPNYGDVNCMKTQSEAEKKWGDLIGKIDPFFYKLKADMIKYNVNTYEVIECKRDNQSEPESENNTCLKDSNNKIINIAVEHEKYPKSYFITQYFKGGCIADYGDERVIKATEHSLMSYNFPVLGSVNRREVERILNMFTGE